MAGYLAVATAILLAGAPVEPPLLPDAEAELELCIQSAERTWPDAPPDIRFALCVTTLSDRRRGRLLEEQAERLAARPPDPPEPPKVDLAAPILIGVALGLAVGVSGTLLIVALSP